MNNYIIYHLHSMLSNPTTVMDSVTPYELYIQEAVKNGMKAIGFSEHGNIFKWWEKKCACEKAGLKYIHGIEMYITKDLNTKVRDNKHCCLIAKNKEGVMELNKLATLSFNDDHRYYNPRISYQELKDTSNNIIITTACLGGILNSGDKEWEDDFIQFLSKNKERCFLEIQHHNDSNKRQSCYNQKLYEISQKTGVKLIAGTDTHSLNEEYAKGRELMQKRKHIVFEEEKGWDLTFKNYDELIESYKIQNSLPEEAYKEAINNTNLLYDMVEDFTMDKSTKYPKIYENSEEVFKQKINEAIKNNEHINKLYSRELINKRVRDEFEVYKATKCIDFMLMQKYLREWEEKNDIQCGFGRGSVSGSFIAYLLKITGMDSIKFNLNFFRFLNPQRVTNSDIDTDYSKKDREKVKEFILKDHMNLPNINTSEIITFNTIALKGAIRDIGGALDMPLIEVDAICKSLDNDAKEMPENLQRKYPELSKYVKIVQGTVTSVGTHPSGVLISSLPIEKTVGLCRIKDCDYPVSDIDMHELDDLMYVKLDILGLDNIGLINDTCKMVGIPRLNPDNVNLEDEKVWEDIVKDTTLIFQWESESGSAYLKKFMSKSTLNKARKVNPNFSMIKWFSFGNGLIRPGCASVREDIAAGKFHDNGLKELNDFLAQEGGIVAMQETIMRFLMKFCGYNNAESDTVRRGIAKKKGTAQLLPEIEKRFIEYTSEHYNVPKEKCQEIIKPFLQSILDASSYGFSWNHSDAYSCIGYICGYLRYYYPLEFLTVALNIFADNKEKSNNILKYVKKKKIKLESPKFRFSKNEFACNKNTNTIYKGLSCVKGLSKTAGDKLYTLKDNQYSTFLDLLIACKEIGVGIADITTLVKIDYFAEFGKIGKLLKFIDIYNELYGKKTLKKDKEYLVKKLFLKDYCSKETDKQYSGFDSYSCLTALFDKLPNTDISLKDKINYQLMYYGYTDIVDKRASQTIWTVLDMKDRSKNKYIDLYRVATGEQTKVKMRASTFDNTPFKIGDLLDIPCFNKEGKWILDNNTGKWARSSTQFEDILNNYKIIEE